MKDGYENYYKGSGVGQQHPSKSMSNLSTFFKKKGVKRVLDFYCGTGRNSIFLAKGGFKIYGFDKSEMAIQMAMTKQERAKTKVKFKLSRLKGELPYKDSFFDAVIAVRALYQAQMTDIEGYVKEIDRIIKTGGYFYIESDQHFTWQRKRFYGQIKTREKGTYRHGSHGDYYHYFTKAELKRLFRNYKPIRFYFKNRRFYILLQKPIRLCRNPLK